VLTVEERIGASYGASVRMSSWTGRGHGMGFDPSKNLFKFIAYGPVNPVIGWTSIDKTVLLPGTSRYSGNLFKFNFRDETSPKL